MGVAWIEAKFPQAPDRIYTHDLALDPDEMELVDPASQNDSSHT